MIGGSIGQLYGYVMPDKRCQAKKELQRQNFYESVTLFFVNIHCCGIGGLRLSRRQME